MKVQFVVAPEGKPHFTFSVEHDAKNPTTMAMEAYFEAHPEVQIRGQKVNYLHPTTGAPVFHEKWTSGWAYEFNLIPEGQLVLELKKVSHNARLSEETEAFVADLYVNGVKRGEVKNEGRGGCNFYSDRTVQAELDAYGKTIPPLVTKDFELVYDADLLVGEVLDEWLDRKMVKRLCAKNTVFRTPDMPKGEYRSLNRKYSPEMAAYVRKEHPNATIMNEVIARG